MNPFQQLLRQTTSSPHHNKMMKSVEPLEQYFGINHFWYYRVTNSGHYSYLGTNKKWDEYCFENQVFSTVRYLRHPSTLPEGISLMKKTSNPVYKEFLKLASEKFNINLSLHLLKKIPEGVEGFGFGLKHKNRRAEEQLLNELPLLCQFYKRFREENNALIRHIQNNQIDLASLIGPVFYENEKQIQLLPNNRQDFLRKLGFQDILDLSDREKQVLKHLSNGFPAQYIADELSLSKRTIEGYIENIKQKLHCCSKVELIKKARDFSATEPYYLDI